MYLSQKNIGLLSMAFLLFAYFEVFTGLYFVSAIGASLFLMIFVKFVQDLGSKIEVRDLIVFLATLQWVVVPILAYNVLPTGELYWMDVDETTYMNYIVPGCIALVIGLYFPLSEERIIGKEQLDKVRIYLKDNKYLGYILVGVGLAASFISGYLPDSLTFLFFLLGNLQFIGVYLLLFGDSKFKWLLFAGLLGMVIMGSILRGMFGQLVLWLMFSLLIIAFVVKIPMFGKVLILSFGMLLVMLIQSTKDEYRQATWYASSLKSNSEIYNELLIDRLTHPSKMFSSAPLENLGARLNQGWIIARIMGHIPEKQAFVKGETIETAIYAGILPRVLAPHKAKAGGHANFERFTGTVLPKGTSMDISVIGEGYANFGVFGGIVFMLIIGLFYNWIIIIVIKISRNHPTLIIWLPLLFFQVIKAETDFATVFNYLTKASLITFLVFWGFNKVLKIKM